VQEILTLGTETVTFKIKTKTLGLKTKTVNILSWDILRPRQQQQQPFYGPLSGTT